MAESLWVRPSKKQVAEARERIKSIHPNRHMVAVANHLDEHAAFLEEKGNDRVGTACFLRCMAQNLRAACTP